MFPPGAPFPRCVQGSARQLDQGGVTADLSANFASYLRSALSPSAWLLLGEVRAANLRGRLYRDPTDRFRAIALEELCAEMLVEPVAPTATDIGGWFALPMEDRNSPAAVWRALQLRQDGLGE